MKLRLGHKLIAGFAAVLLLAGLSMVLILNVSTRSRYFQFVGDSDIAVAESVALTLGFYYRTEGSWDAIAAVIEGSRFGFGMSSGRMAAMPMNRGRGMIMSQLPLYTRIVLTDPSGRVLADSGEDELEVFPPADAFAAGAAVSVNNSVIGLVYAGTMVEPQLHPIQREFLESLNRTAIIALVVGLGLAILIGAFLQRQFIRPLVQLTGASREIAEGRLSTRVNIQSHDEIGDLGASFNAMADSMEGAVKWRKQIVADVAHELRTPLSLIQGRLEMILDKVYPADATQIGCIFEETQRLNELVENIEELSRSEANQLFINRSLVSVLNIANSVLLQYRDRAQAQNIEMRIQPNEVPQVSADIELIKRVLANLISNALQHTSPGGSIDVRATDNAARKMVTVCVADTGPGIPEEELERIFERFYRVDDARSRQSGGSGLGLAICREIVNKHGGRIWAERPESGGAVICFTLPALIESSGS